MKNVMYLTIAMSLLATAASARTVYYPQEACAEIVSSEYSTGGGDSSFELFEVLCKSAKGEYVALITSWTSAAGMFGFGRAFHETEIKLVPYDGTELKAE
jgi:hypothetical protein